MVLVLAASLEEEMEEEAEAEAEAEARSLMARLWCRTLRQVFRKRWWSAWGNLKNCYRVRWWRWLRRMCSAWGLRRRLRPCKDAWNPSRPGNMMRLKSLRCRFV